MTVFSWEGNCRSDIALVIRYKLQWSNCLQAYEREMSPVPAV